jgi:hypothetical protein
MVLLPEKEQERHFNAQKGNDNHSRQAVSCRRGMA